MVDARQIETLGPAERILQALLTYSDHLYHNRPGMVTEDARTSTGVRWVPAPPARCRGRSGPPGGLGPLRARPCSASRPPR